MASKLVSKKALRARFVNNDMFAAQLDKAWVLETPYDVREKAICDYEDRQGEGQARQAQAIQNVLSEQERPAAVVRYEESPV